MNNNDTLRRLRYALNIRNSSMIAIFKLSNKTFTEAEIMKLLKKEDDDGFVECANDVLCAFLDGFIIEKRGPSDKKVAGNTNILSNNMILKKIRIALEIKEVDMLKILKLGGMQLSKYELSALFRRQNHRNYKPCGDQLLRNFLNGLVKLYRPEQTTEKQN